MSETRTCARCAQLTQTWGYAHWSIWGNKPLCPKCLVVVQRVGPSETKPETVSAKGKL